MVGGDRPAGGARGDGELAMMRSGVEAFVISFLVSQSYWLYRRTETPVNLLARGVVAIVLGVGVRGEDVAAVFVNGDILGIEIANEMVIAA